MRLILGKNPYCQLLPNCHEGRKGSMAKTPPLRGFCLATAFHPLPGKNPFCQRLGNDEKMRSGKRDLTFYNIPAFSNLRRTPEDVAGVESTRLDTHRNPSQAICGLLSGKRHNETLSSPKGPTEAYTANLNTSKELTLTSYNISEYTPPRRLR